MVVDSIENYGKTRNFYLLQQVVVPAQEKGSPIGETLRQLQLGSEDVFPCTQALQVGNADVGDNAHLRLCRQGQVLNLPQSGHSHLHHRRLGVFFNGKESFGRSNLVIQVPLGFYGGKAGGKHRRRHLLGGGLAHAAGDAHHPDRHFAPIPGGKGQQSL